MWTFDLLQAALLKMNAIKLFVAGGQEAVVAAMQRFPSVESLQAPAVTCLCLLGYTFGYSQGLVSLDQVSTYFARRSCCLIS